MSPPEAIGVRSAHDPAVKTVQDDPLALEQRDDLPSFVPQLPPVTFVQVARGLRGEDRLDLLLPHATPDQLTALLDLDGWSNGRIAVDKARALGHSLEGAVLASDAFFPFADGVELALQEGVAAIVQPGGSKRDDEVIQAVEAAGAAMVFTHRRHFRH